MRIVSVGELLWDVFPDSERLGGAPFNFAVHARRLGHDVVFLSAVGDDERGRAALERAAALGLPAEFIQRAAGVPTGAVTVELDAAGVPTFTIHRPAAYDKLRLDGAARSRIAAFAPEWIYFGTLHQTDPHVRAEVAALLEAAPGARRFYDVNLRRDSYNAGLVSDLLRRATVVKLNEEEVKEVDRMTGARHGSIEEFCRGNAPRFGWEAVCVTRGERGCAVLARGEYAEAPGYPVRVADTVGSGDAFAAAFLDGLGRGWDAACIGDFANRLGAVVASRPGGVPDWNLADCRALSR